MKSDWDKLVDILRTCAAMGETHGTADWVIGLAHGELRAFLNIEFDEGDNIKSICGKEL